MGTEENKAAARRFMEEVISRGNVAAIDELSARELIDHDAPPGVPAGNEGFKKFVTAFRAAFPDLHYTIEDDIAEGDLVVQRVRARGTMQGEFQGRPPSGKTATWQEIHITRFRDGKAVEHWGVVAHLGMLAQLGFAQPPGQPVDARS